ncbi:hypothetical protein APHAL10511_008103 [Amanita phalloides]|nr:hypothetical protein APHAL10511_008103 [Amanita phalloides]
MFFSALSVLFFLFVASAGIKFIGQPVKGPQAKFVGSGSLDQTAKIVPPAAKWVPPAAAGPGHVSPSQPGQPGQPLLELQTCPFDNNTSLTGWRTVPHITNENFPERVKYYTIAHKLCLYEMDRRKNDECLQREVERMTKEAEMAAIEEKKNAENKANEEKNEDKEKIENEENEEHEEDEENANVRKKRKGRKRKGRKQRNRNKKVRKGY